MTKCRKCRKEIELDSDKVDWTLDTATRDFDLCKKCDLKLRNIIKKWLTKSK